MTSLCASELRSMRKMWFVAAMVSFTALATGFPSCVNFTTIPSKQRKNAFPSLKLSKKPPTHNINLVSDLVTQGGEWNALKVLDVVHSVAMRVRYSRDQDGYYDLPWSVEEAVAGGGWQKISSDDKLNVDVFSQPQDPRLMLLFDKKGTIAGIRLAFLKKDVPRRAEEGGYTFDFDYDNNPMYEKGNYFRKDLWHTTVLLTSPQVLAGGGRNKLDKSKDDVATGIYFKDNGEWTEVSKDECKPNKEFFEGRCVAGMGKHYFYKLNMTDCRRLQPLWSLYDHGRLAGMGLAGYGSFTKTNNTRSYYEHGVIPSTLDLLPLCFSDYTIYSIFSLDAIKSIMRKVPPCIEEYAEKFGLTMMHVFLKRHASSITCPPKEWRLSGC